jgi:hypothetical protein
MLFQNVLSMSITDLEVSYNMLSIFTADLDGISKHTQYVYRWPRRYGNMLNMSPADLGVIS